MSSFDEWLEQHPYGWHPGRGWKQEQHCEWVQGMILATFGLNLTGLGDMTDGWLNALESELPNGFMGPYDLTVYKKLEQMKVESELPRLTKELQTCVDKIACIDSDMAITLARQMAYRVEKAQRLAEHRRKNWRMRPALIGHQYCLETNMKQNLKLISDFAWRFIVLFSMLVVVFAALGHEVFEFTRNPFAKSLASLVVGIFVLYKAVPVPKSLISDDQIIRLAVEREITVQKVI